MSISKITKSSPQRIWRAWEQAHQAKGGDGLHVGATGQIETPSRKIPYKVIEVTEEKSFSILWKALWVRFIFTHQMYPTPFGCKILYDYHIQGLLAWPIRWMLGASIQRNLSSALETFVRQLERGLNNKSEMRYP